MASRLNEEQKQRIWSEYQKCQNYAEVARKFGINWKTVKKYVEELDAKFNASVKAQAVALKDNPNIAKQVSTVDESRISRAAPEKINDESIFPKFAKRRKSGLTCTDCAIELKLSREQAEKMEIDYLHLEKMDRWICMAKTLQEENIDCEPFIKMMKEKEPIGNYFKKIEELEGTIRKRVNTLRDLNSQIQATEQKDANLLRAIEKLRRNEIILVDSNKKLESDLRVKNSEFIRLSNWHKEEIKNFEMQCQVIRINAEQVIRKVIQHYMQNDNGKLEDLWFSLFLALRENRSIQFEIFFSQIFLNKAALIQRCRGLLVRTLYIFENYLLQSALNGDPEIDTKHNSSLQPNLKEVATEANQKVQTITPSHVPPEISKSVAGEPHTVYPPPVSEIHEDSRSLESQPFYSDLNSLLDAPSQLGTNQESSPPF